MPPLSVVIVACDEAEFIADALDSVAWADDIVVVDSGSTDGTPDLCRARGARVLHRAWDGFIGQKNYALQQARHDWVLNLDADERVSEALRQSIVEALRPDTPAYRGYRVARCSWFLGRFIRHGGWYPDYRVRLWDRRFGAFGGYEPHADVKLNAAAATLTGDLIHYPYRDIADHWARINRYTTIMAQALYAKGRRGHYHDLFFHPAWTLVRKLIVQRGFLDGYAGVVVAGLAAGSVFAKYAKLIELHRCSASEDGPLNKSTSPLNTIKK